MATPISVADIEAWSRGAGSAIPQSASRFGPKTSAAIADIEARRKAAMLTGLGKTAPKAPGTGAANWWASPGKKISLPNISPTAGKVLGATGRVATAAAPIIEAGKVGAVALDPNASGADVAEQTATGAGKLASAGIGATLGAKVGTMLGFGTPATAFTLPAGAFVGGAAGYFGGEKLISTAKGALGLDPRSPYERVSSAPVAPAAPPTKLIDNVYPIQPEEEAMGAQNLQALSTPVAPAATGPGARPEQFVNRAAPGSLASFFGAAMNQKRLAGQEKAARETELAMPEFLKTQAETANLNELNRLAAAEKDPEKRRLILSKLAAPAEEKMTFPQYLQPTDMKAGYGVGAQAGKLAQVPIKQLPRATIAELQTYAKSKGQTLTPAQLRSMAAEQGITVTD